MNDISLNHLISQEKTYLKTFALKFTRNIEDAEDLVQDTLLKAMRNTYLFKEGTNLRGWLFTILKNTYINAYRRSVRKKSLIDTKDEITSEQLNHKPSANASAYTFMMDDILKAMSGLQNEYLTPFLLYFEGYKYNEIAEQLNIPLGTVKTRIHAARQILKAKLKMYDDDFRRNIRTI